MYGDGAIAAGMQSEVHGGAGLYPYLLLTIYLGLIKGQLLLREKALPVYWRGMSWRVGRLAMRVVAA